MWFSSSKRIVYSVLVLGSLAAASGLVAVPFGDNTECLNCAWSVGVAICILADEGETGFESCYAGTNCLYVNGPDDYRCFDNSCRTSFSCITAPWPG